MRHPFSTNVHGVSFMGESVFASKFPLRKTVPGHMPLIPHAKPMRNAVASASESSTVACLANAMVPTNVVSDEIKDANAHTETITAVSQPFATSAAYMVHAKAPLHCRPFPLVQQLLPKSSMRIQQSAPLTRTGISADAIADLPVKSLPHLRATALGINGYGCTEEKMTAAIGIPEMTHSITA